MKKLIITLFLTLSMASLAACGKKEASNNSANDPGVDVQVEDNTTAVEVLQTLWDQIPDENKFPTFGGSVEQSVDGAAGEVALNDENTLVNVLLIPTDVQEDAAEVASLVHMMNTNTFTSAVVKLSEFNPTNAADRIKDTFLNTQFLCGVPEKITIATYGNYVIYAYGEASIVDEFMGNVAIFDGAEIKVDQTF